VWADLDAAAWNKLKTQWNRSFRGDPPSELYRNLIRGNFPDKVFEIAVQDAVRAMKMIDATVKETEAYLKEKAKGKVKVLDELREADDPRALKLLATTVKMATADTVALTKVRKDLAEKLETVKKGLTLTKRGWTGPRELMQKKTLHEASDALLGPCFTHALKVKRSALSGFTGAKGDKAVNWILSSGLKDKDWEVRTGVVEALAEIQHPKAVEALTSALKDKDPAVRTAALSSLITQDAKQAKPAILACLKDRNWEVRVGALEAVESLGFKDVETLDALIEAMQKEEGRLCDDFEDTLRFLTKKTYYGDPKLWKRWWEDNREKYVARAKGGEERPKEGEPAPLPKDPPPAHKGPQATTSFYGIETKSHKIIYILDVSGSMAEKANLDSLPEGAKGPVVTGGKGHKGPDPDPGDRPQGDTKLDVLKWQLKRTIRMLPHKATFNVLFYNDKFEVWSEKMVVATPMNKKKVFEYIDKQKAQGRTNIFDPLEKAFQIATAGPRAGGAGDPRYASNMGGADTFYLLSDGSPNAGRIPDSGGILAEVRKINKLRKVVIHTVAVGGAYNPSFMERLAQENGGKCVVVK
jgi:hypothetical protein